MAESVTVYSLPTCPHCIAAKAFLDERGVPFTSHDVGADGDAFAAMHQLTGKNVVPVIVVGDEYRVGFNRPEIEALLAAAGY
ncbi:MAG: glutaredoxin family protein [Deltaproteobacteria bacterium]|nr:glutaredoxin family protein [Candidatus Anaeroferrophillacea bacterium]